MERKEKTKEQLLKELTEIEDRINILEQTGEERKEKEKALHEELNFAMKMIHESPTFFITLNPDGKVLLMNETMLHALGYKGTDVVGKDFLLTFVPKDKQQIVSDAFKTLIEQPNPITIVFPMVNQQGNAHLIEWHYNPVMKANKILDYIFGVGIDITEKKISEQSLKESEEKFKMLAEQSPNMIFIYKQGRVVYANRKCEETMGYTRDEYYQSNFDFMTLIAPESQEKINAAMEKHIKGEDVQPYDYILVTKSGERIQAIITPKLIDYEGEKAILGIITDITERMQIVSQLQESEERYRNVVEQTFEGIVIVQGMPPRIVFVNTAFCQIFGYTQEELKQIDNPIQILMPEDEHAPIMERFAALMQGAQPVPREARIVKKDGSECWLEIFGRVVEYHGAPAMQVTTRDITDRKQMEENLKESVRKLETLMHSTIDSMATILETRDPYTAGHQQRAARLAKAIAREMGFSDEQTKGLHMAATIHDIGKIYVPAEILSRPSTLTESEIALIHTHPKVGYDILKKIEFPWPVADIVLQHHERLDGSGYPQGLKNNEIIIEARILAVADVVEAMSSHRPYRAAQSLESTLDEIEKHKETLYDSSVVEVCLSLFRDKNFKFTDK